MWLRHRFTLSFRDVEDLLDERGITVSLGSGSAVVSKVRSRVRAQPAPPTRSTRRYLHVDEAFIRIRGERHYLWRAVDQDGHVLDILATNRRDARAAKRFYRTLVRGQGGLPWQLVKDRLGSYAAANRGLGLMAIHRTNRAEVSDQHTRERERQMRNFKLIGQELRFLAVHSAIGNAIRVARHRLHAMQRRLCRERAFNTWNLAACVGCKTKHPSMVGSEPLGSKRVRTPGKGPPPPG